MHPLCRARNNCWSLDIFRECPTILSSWHNSSLLHGQSKFINVLANVKPYFLLCLYVKPGSCMCLRHGDMSQTVLESILSGTLKAHMETRPALSCSSATSFSLFVSLPRPVLSLPLLCKSRFSNQMNFFIRRSSRTWRRRACLSRPPGRTGLTQCSWECWRSSWTKHPGTCWQSTANTWGGF